MDLDVPLQFVDRLSLSRDGHTSRHAPTVIYLWFLGDVSLGGDFLG